MRISFKHHQEQTGTLRNKAETFIDCTVEFSEEEKAIIKLRSLEREGITTWQAVPPPDAIEAGGLDALRYIAPAMAGIGLVLGIATNSAPPAYLLFAGLGLWAFYFWRRQRLHKIFKQGPTRTITIKEILSHPTFTVWARTPLDAKVAEQNLRDEFTRIKSLITESSSIQDASTFEL